MMIYGLNGCTVFIIIVYKVMNHLKLFLVITISKDFRNNKKILYVHLKQLVKCPGEYRQRQWIL